MRKSALILVISVLFMFSCKSTAETTEDTSAAVTVSPAVPEPAASAGTSNAAAENTSAGKYAAGSIDETYYNIYNKYSGSLDLTGAIRYTVQSGDALNRIANTYYHDPHYYPLIMLASKDVVVDPEKIAPGMVLTIPDLQRNLSGASSKQVIKNAIIDVSEVRRARGEAEAANNLRNLANSL